MPKLYYDYVMIMNKYLRFAVLLCFVTFTQNICAQLHVGMKVGMNITKIKYDISIADESNRNGFFIGPMLDFSSIMGLGFDISALYDERSVKVGVFDDVWLGDEVEKIKFINIPLNIKYSIGLAKTVGLFVSAGPQFSFNIGDKKFFEDVLEEGNTFNVSDSQFSINVGGGLKLMEHLQLGYNYNLGFGRTGSIEFKSLNLKTDYNSSSHQIYVAYLF